MAGVTVNKIINQSAIMQGLFTKDAGGNAAQGVTYHLNFVSGDPTGLALVNPGGVFQVQCIKVGTYQVNITATNSGGSLTTDAAGDGGGAFDTFNVTEPPPSTQGWTWN